MVIELDLKLNSLCGINFFYLIDVFTQILDFLFIVDIDMEHTHENSGIGFNINLADVNPVLL
ncbi:MAG: hypothetical protein BWY67_02380 [Bacteroidetes bacterium ADurb.Bin397]|nr:MAG: hypothetical protein BWY67_02380 [Bacteroidetes bacterium ADurb.Bin397]